MLKRNIDIKKIMAPLFPAARLLCGDFLNLIYPLRKTCPICGRPWGYTDVCQDCRAIFAEYGKRPSCEKCGKYFMKTYSGKLCKECLLLDKPFRMARAVGPYNGTLKETIHRFKYGRQRHLARHLAGLMADVVLTCSPYTGVQMIVPVPASPDRIQERGFNHAELLAREVAARIGLPFVAALRKIKETSSQTALTRQKRKESIKGAFISFDNVRGSSILLVDDVLTTGATAAECASALISAGACNVFVITIATGTVYQ